jgi:hypothetical protein
MQTARKRSRATLNTPQGKVKLVMDLGEATSSHFKKKKKKKNDKCHRDANLVAEVEHKASSPKGNLAKPGPPKDHFEKILDTSCPHHEVLVKHVLNDTLKPRAAYPPKKGGPSPDNDDDAGAMYLGEDGAVHMIFGGSPARLSRQREKLIQREVFNTDTTKLSYQKWSEVLITSYRKDHPDHVPEPGYYPKVVAPLFKSKLVHKVLMDG